MRLCRLVGVTQQSDGHNAHTNKQLIVRGKGTAGTRNLTGTWREGGIMLHVDLYVDASLLRHRPLYEQY